MDNRDAAPCLAALGNPLRLAVYRILVRAGHSGLTAGQVQARMGLSASTLSHHLAALGRVGLIRRRRSGTTLICAADFEVIQALVGYLQSECCVDADVPL